MSVTRLCSGGLPRPSREALGRQLEELLETVEGCALQTSLRGLVELLGLHDEAEARRAVIALEPVDHAVSVDATRVHADTPFWIEWSPVTGIVNLMLDWGLSELDIATAELAGWLEVDEDVAKRAVIWLSDFPGVEVSPFVERADWLHLALDAARCPLTSSSSGSAA